MSASYLEAFLNNTDTSPNLPDMDSTSNDSGKESLKIDLSQTVHVEIETSTMHTGSLGPPIYDSVATKRLLRKLDIRLLPFLSLLYL